MGVTVNKKALRTQMPRTPLLEANKGVYRLIKQHWNMCCKKQIPARDLSSRYRGMSQFDKSEELQAEWKKLIIGANKL